MSKKEKPKLQAVPDSPSPKKQYKFIVGTEGGFDYLVVAQKNDVCLGLKPLIGLTPTPGGTVEMIVGARIRVARETKEAGSVVSINADPNVTSFSEKLTFQKAFPDMKWEKIDDVRASSQIALPLPSQPWKKGSTEANLAKVKVYKKMYNYIVKHAGEENLILDEEAITKFVQDKYHDMIKEIESVFPEQDIEPNIEVDFKPLDAVFNQMLDPKKMKQQQMEKAGLSVIEGDGPDPRQDNTPDDDGDGVPPAA